MKNLKYIMSTLMVALAVAVVFVACSKEKENGADLPSDRKPLATYDTNAGTMTSLIDINTLNVKLNKFYATRGDADRYVIESAEVLDSVPRNKDVRGEIKITILDTKEECSYSIWCMNSFVVKDVKEHQVNYYLDENVANGNFNIAFKERDNYYIADFVGDSLSTHNVDPLEYGFCPWYIFTCRSTDCLQNCDKEGTAWHAYCRPCSSYFVGGECNADFSGVIGVIILAGRILKYFV